MATRRADSASHGPFAVALIIAVLGGPVLLWLRLPGLVVVVVALTVAGAVHPTPVAAPGSRARGAGRQPGPEGRENRKLERHRRIRALRGLCLPVGLWPAQTSLVAGAGAALMGWSLRVVAPVGWPLGVARVLEAWGPLSNALSAMVLVVGGERVWREGLSVVDRAPGTPLSLLAQVGRPRLLVVAVGPLVGAVIVRFGLFGLVGGYYVASVGAASAGGVLLGGAAGVWVMCRRRSWASWRQRRRGRREWVPRWAMVPKEEAAPPVLVDRLVDGPLVVDTFRCRPGTDLAWYVKLRAQIAAAVGQGASVRVLAAPELDAEGRRVEGRTDPSRFRVAVMSGDISTALVADRLLMAEFEWAERWLAVPKAEPAPVLVSREVAGPYTAEVFDAPGRSSRLFLRMGDKVAVGVGAGVSTVVVPEPDAGVDGGVHPTRFRVLTCPQGTQTDVGQADASEVRVCVERFLAGVVDSLRCEPMMVRDLELLTVPGPGQVWRVGLAGGPIEQVAELLGLEVAPALCDGQDLILGEVQGARWVDPAMAVRIADLEVARQWTAHFREVIKAGDTPPVPQASHLDVLEAGDAEIYRLPFASPQGKDIARDYLPLGQRLRTTLPRAPFLFVTAVPPTEGASAPGARSDKFFAVVWSERPVPSCPAELAPGDGVGRVSRVDRRDGPQLVLAGMVDEAFRAVFGHGRVPQTLDARCLAIGPPWMWCVRLRLYGGLNLADLRRRSDRLRALLRTEWLRFRSDGELVEMFVGASPIEARVGPEHRRVVAELDFEQAWAAARVVTAAGEVPRMDSMEPLEGNDRVMVHEFTLPAGLTDGDVKAGLGRVAATLRAGFLQVVAQADPSRVVVMSARDHPLPERVDYDFACADALVSQARERDQLLRIPWGAGVDGRPVTWRVKDTAHALALGITGTGKSVALGAAVYATVLAGWDVVVIDPVKGGADFAALGPWLRGLGGGSIAEAEAMMKAVYAEVRRRKNLVTESGVPGIEELPRHLRPAHVLLVMDEFTSLMLVEAVRRVRTADPEVLADYERADRENSQRASIGSLAARVAREARSSGVHLLLGTQVLKADTISRIPGGDLKNNLGRLLLGMPTAGERLSGLRQPELAPTITVAPVGRGMWEETTGAAVEMQTWFARAEDYAAQLEARGVPVRRDWDVEAFMAPPMAEAYAEVELPGAWMVGEPVMLQELDLTDLDLDGRG